MPTKQDVFGLVNASSQIRRSPLIGMQLLHQRAVSPANFGVVRPGLKAKDLIGFLLRHWSGGVRRAALPRCRIGLRVLTPSGHPAVKIRC